MSGDDSAAGSPPTTHAGVLGSPVGHSLSPVLHTAAYRALGLTGWTYTAHEVVASELAGFVAGLDGSWAGLSLTMPLKEAALRVAHEVSPLAAELGAANTLLRREDGGWSADNTDVYGARLALQEVGAEDGAVRHAVVIGSGATARSVLAALAELGTREVTFVVRAEARPDTVALAERLGLAVGVCVDPGDGGDADAVVGGAALVVSTVPAGAADALAARLPADAARGQLLLDVVYDGWPTPLGRAFAARGARVAGGLDLLVHQAVAQVRLMTGLEPPLAAMREAGVAALSRR